MVDVLGYLQSKGLHLKPAPGDEVHTACWYCGEDAGKRGRLYINTNSNRDPDGDPPAGLFECKICGERGAINKIRKHFGDPVFRDDDNDEVISPKRHAALQVAAAYYHECLLDNETALKYLREDRGLTVETIVKHQLGWADGTLHRHLKEKGFSTEDGVSTGLIRENGHDFLSQNITLPYHFTGGVTQIRGKQIGGKYFTPPGNKARLFNVDGVRGEQKVVLTEGEFDALVMEQLGFAAAGVPGASTWQDGWNDFLDKAVSVHVVFDNDTAGISGAEKVATHLGGKVRIVTMPDGDPKNDPTEWVVNKGHGADDFRALFAKSRGGLLVTVDEAFDEWKEVQNLDGIKMGYKQLDTKIEPGILPAQVMIVLAKTGTGKTVWTINAFYRMLLEQPDLKILFVSLEQTRGEWFERAQRIYRFYNLDASYMDCLDFYRDRLMIMDKNRITEDELVASIEQYQLEMGEKPDLVAIDYLGYWARGYKGEPYERTSKAVMALKAIAKDQKIAFLAPHQVNRGAAFGEQISADASRDSGVVEETADFMLSLWASDAKKGLTESEKTGRVNLKIVKSRHGGVGSETHLQFAPLSLAMIPEGDDSDLLARARSEYEMAMRHDDFDTAIYRHSTGDDRGSIPPQEIEAWKRKLGVTR